MISAIIVNRNEAEKLDNCLLSVKEFADEMIVVDLESTDSSKSIAKKRGAKFVPHPLVPIVEEVRQEALKHAKHDWVLFLDPDEEITPDFQAEVKDLFRHEVEFDYLEVPRKNIIFRKWLRHSRWWPDYQVRFFRKEAVFFPKEIHSQPVTKGKAYALPAKESLAIIHTNYQNFEEYFAKNVRYAKTEANRLKKTGKKPGLAETIRKAISEFISRFFAGHGYRDGMHGFALAVLQMFYYFLVHFFYWETEGYVSPEDERELTDHAEGFFRQGYRESLYWQGRRKPLSWKERLVGRLISKQ